MPSIIDFTKFEFTAEQIRNIKDLVFDDIVKAPEITLLCTLYPGIVFKKEIGFIGEGGLVGKAAQGCNPTPQQWKIGTRKVVWEPVPWEIVIEQCWTDLESAMTVYSMHTGVQRPDFTDTDYMAIVVEVLSLSIKKFIIRLFWFNDKDATAAVVEELPTAALTVQTAGDPIVGTVYKNVIQGTPGAVKVALSTGQIFYLDGTAATGNAVAGTDYFSRDDINKTTVVTGGILTPGSDITYFNIFDGFWKQMLEQVTVNPKQRVTIIENAGATYEAQELNPENMKSYLQKLAFKAPIVLRGQSGAFIACTQSFYDAYYMYLQGKDLDATYVNLVDGRKVLTFNGISLIPVPVWDEMIAMYENTGFRLNNPHRAVYVFRELLAAGVDGENSFDDMNVFYDKKTRTVTIELMGKADSKILNPELFQIAI